MSVSRIISFLLRVLVSVSIILVSKKSLSLNLKNVGLKQKVSVSVSMKILVSLSGSLMNDKFLQRIIVMFFSPDIFETLSGKVAA